MCISDPNLTLFRVLLALNVSFGVVAIIAGAILFDLSHFPESSVQVMTYLRPHLRDRSLLPELDQRITSEKNLYVMVYLASVAAMLLGVILIVVAIDIFFMLRQERKRKRRRRKRVHERHGQQAAASQLEPPAPEQCRLGYTPHAVPSQEA